MAPNFINFTTTPRNHRSDVVNNHGKITTAKIAPLTEAELLNSKSLIADAFALLGISNVDSTATCSLSLTSGSMVLFQLTV